MNTSTAELEYLHPYICERCFRDIPLTERQYLEAIDQRGRLFCQDCLQKKHQKPAAP